MNTPGESQDKENWTWRKFWDLLTMYADYFETIVHNNYNKISTLIPNNFV